MPSSKRGGGIQTLVTNRQTGQKQHAFLKGGWGGIQTLVTNRQTGQKQHAFLKGGRHTNFSYKQTDRTKTTCLPQRGGRGRDIQTLVTNRQTGQKQHAFLKGGRHDNNEGPKGRC